MVCGFVREVMLWERFFSIKRVVKVVLVDDFDIFRVVDVILGFVYYGNG